ncbi:MAG: glycosyltransferase, partial [Candidatus Korarchaeota archaeon]|nr:glycosyltransferase [Candidatus Korarchaeota archaeon]
MKVLVISPHYNTFVKGAVEALAREVESIEVLVHHNRLTDLLRFIPFGGYLDYARRFTREKLLNTEGKPENVRIYLISKPYFPPSSRNPRVGDIFAKEMLEVIRRERIETNLIHAHFIWPPGYIGAKLKEVLGLPLVITGHGYDVYDLPFRSEEWRERVSWALSKADAVTTVSSSNRRILV